MAVSLKYAQVERERRWLLAGVPEGLPAESRMEISDRYLVGTRLRLREVRTLDGVVRKLNHKVRLGEGPEEIACTSVYLDDREWAVLSALPGRDLRKVRTRTVVDGVLVCIDEFVGHCQGLVLAEVDGGPSEAPDLPADLHAVLEVTADETFTGAALAASTRDDVAGAVVRHGVQLD